MFRRTLLLLILLTTPVLAEVERGITEAQEQGFKVIAAIVHDRDWQEKWETPRTTTPTFKVSEQVTPKDRPTLLIFFSPPDFAIQPQRLMCQIVITQAGKKAYDSGDLDCYNAPLSGSQNDLFLATRNVSFSFDETEIGDELRFDVTVTDPLRGLVVPVTVYATVVAEEQQ